MNVVYCLLSTVYCVLSFVSCLLSIAYKTDTTRMADEQKTCRPEDFYGKEALTTKSKILAPKWKLSSAKTGGRKCRNRRPKYPNWGTKNQNGRIRFGLVVYKRVLASMYSIIAVLLARVRCKCLNSLHMSETISCDCLAVQGGK